MDNEAFDFHSFAKNNLNCKKLIRYVIPLKKEIE